MIDASAELSLLADAHQRAARYLQEVNERRVFPADAALSALKVFDEPFPEQGRGDAETLALLDDIGSPATVASNGPNYFGFVVGACLPAAAAAERLAGAWDQAAASFDNSPIVATLERVAGRWMLEALDLPRESVVGFGTSAGAGGLGCLAVARRSLLGRLGWDLDEDGLCGAPEIEVVAPATVHITIKKALRLLGFGLRRVKFAPVDLHGRIDLAQMPKLGDKTILCLQAGEVNTGEFDLFEPLIERARNDGAWVHVDGAFGLWARASGDKKALTDGVDDADSWTVDAHKWLNTPYDCAMAICRHKDNFAAAMRSDAVYAASTPDAQRNLTLEFSRRARGVPVWAALRTLGHAGVAAIVDKHCAQAKRLAEGLAASGYAILNRVVLNQVLVRGDDDAQTHLIRETAQKSGEIWFGPTTWEGRPAFRLSVSSWRTTDAHIDRAIELLARIKRDN